ncbi:MAG: tRNA (adenosine(37)-N6)-threonylcarbamoyltransferase complex dimerization subunit type 1 TsaB [Nitrospina sp.]|nr:tRNA (adenosine(37)-N6)-threonylcarbamoyltransferase complex dimerization subunit type 1 TsaB [Nitrospina sp.]
MFTLVFKEFTHVVFTALPPSFSLHKTMILLGLDASTPKGSVALLQDGEIIAESVADSAFSDQLLVLIDTVLNALEGGLDKVDGFCVTTGPGSFTGLRVGVSLIKGLVLATEKPFWGINTLEAYANLVQPTSHPISPILDARKKEVYTARFKYIDDELVRETPDQAVSPQELCEQTQEPTVFFGGGLEPYSELLASQLGDKFIASTQNHTVAASATLLAYHRFRENPCFDLDTLNIHYVRKSEAELNSNILNQEVIKHGH